MPAEPNKSYSLGDEAIKQLAAAVRWVEQRVDRLAADSRRPGRQVNPLPKFGQVVSAIAAGATGELDLLDDDNVTTGETITVKNRWDHTDAPAGARAVAIWWRGGWMLNNWECPE